MAFSDESPRAARAAIRLRRAPWDVAHRRVPRARGARSVFKDAPPEGVAVDEVDEGRAHRARRRVRKRRHGDEQVKRERVEEQRAGLDRGEERALTGVVARAISEREELVA